MQSRFVPLWFGKHITHICFCNRECSPCNNIFHGCTIQANIAHQSYYQFVLDCLPILILFGRIKMLFVIIQTRFWHFKIYCQTKLLSLPHLSCRIEQVHLNRKDGKAKVLGTLASVAGAIVITLYKGPTIYGPPSDSQYLNQSHSRLSLLGDAKEKNWTLGCICLIGHCLCWSSWIVLQVPVLKNYPARLSVSSFTCFFGILQCSAIAGIVERESQAWQIHSGGEVFAILYAVGVQIINTCIIILDQPYLLTTL